MIIQKPDLSKTPEYYQYYINLVEQNNLPDAFQLSKQLACTLIESLEDSKLGYAYQPDKWTVYEVLQHIIDTERILAYRALRFSRFDTTMLSGFDENKFIAAIQANIHYSKKNIFDEFCIVRDATIILYNNMNEKMLDFVGQANKNITNARQIGFFIIGHQLHHIRVIEEKYL